MGYDRKRETEREEKRESAAIENSSRTDHDIIEQNKNHASRASDKCK